MFPICGLYYCIRIASNWSDNFICDKIRRKDKIFKDENVCQTKTFKDINIHVAKIIITVEKSQTLELLKSY